LVDEADAVSAGEHVKRGRGLQVVGWAAVPPFVMVELCRRERSGVKGRARPRVGGDSVVAIQLVSQAAQRSLHLAPEQLFENQTIAALARVLADRQAGAAPLEPPAPAVSPPTEVEETVSAVDYSEADLSQESLERLLTKLGGRGCSVQAPPASAISLTGPTEGQLSPSVSRFSEQQWARHPYPGSTRAGWSQVS
jgi:phosphopantetheine binding protein